MLNVHNNQHKLLSLSSRGDVFSLPLFFPGGYLGQHLSRPSRKRDILFPRRHGHFFTKKASNGDTIWDMAKWVSL